VTVPAVVVEYTGDCSVFPSDIWATVDALGSRDVRHVRIRSDHFGRPLGRIPIETVAPAICASVSSGASSYSSGRMT